MTRINHKASALVLEGSEVKLRLKAERRHSSNVVHVDWLRFTCLLRTSPGLDTVDALWEGPMPAHAGYGDLSALPYDPAKVARDAKEFADWSMRRLIIALRRYPDADFSASVQAGALGLEVCEALGDDFALAGEPAKGHDFYRYRLPILRNAVEVGWVGYLASGDSPRSCGQANTLHVNLYGAACTFAAPGWRDRMADLIDNRDATITRADLALDFFDGLEGGMLGVLAEYESGACDVGGKRLNCNMLGDWTQNGGARSFYLGSKQAGKQTNVYEKGHQLFGRETLNPWTRIELRYGNKLRVLDTDILRRPDDFFAGASPWHQAKLQLIRAGVAPQVVKCLGRLPMETVNAEVSRLIRWAKNTAGPTIAALWKFAPGEIFADFENSSRLPGRIGKFSPQEIGAAFNRLTTIGGACPSPA